jgi:protein-S-isoprenylcysteine O-methyltransferase Ste14
VTRISNPLVRWLQSTSNRTFALWPIVVFSTEAALRSGVPPIDAWGLAPLAWGYLQYRLAGLYRLRRGGGGPGVSTPPVRLVTDGPYRFCRNPMYLGHLIFLAGIAWTLHSWVGAGVFAFHAAWFRRRVLDDEARLASQFGDAYRDYAARVKRWIPGLL